MTPTELVQAACPKIGSLGGAFYFDKETLAKGKELGRDGFRFYFLGRGGVLGDVEPRVVESAFGYFAPELVAKMWTSAKEKLAPREAGRLYLECLHAFGRRKFSGISGLDAFCAAAEAVNNATSYASLPLYAAFSSEGRLNLMNATFAQDEKPIDENCGCYTCKTFSRAYLRHLIVAKELLAGTLLSIHNLHTMIELVSDIRTSIIDGRFESKVPAWLKQWQGNAERSTKNTNKTFVHLRG